MSESVTPDLVLAPDAASDPGVLREGGLYKGPPAVASKFTAQRVRRILTLMRAKPLPISVVAPQVGIHPRTLQRWLQAGAEAAEQDRYGDPYLEFAVEFLKAQGQAKEALIDDWKRVAVDTMQWAGLATLAERVWSEDFKKPLENTTNVNVNVGVGVFEQRLADARQKIEVESGGSGYTGG